MQRGSFVSLILCFVIAGLLVQPSPAAELSLRVTYSFGSNGLDGNTPTWIGYGPDGDIYARPRLAAHYKAEAGPYSNCIANQMEHGRKPCCGAPPRHSDHP
ncbi:MAG: hypothetical protein H0U76_27310 [Ktedonobacteraceae bacterium]|nr:hypothetical protein [Ktedonobacteraceae bacterium]